MAFVKVLLTTAFLTGAFAGFLWAFSKEKGDGFFSEMAADGSVLCNAWMQWPDKKIIVLGAEDAPAGVLNGWHILPVADGTNYTYPTKTAHYMLTVTADPTGIDSISIASDDMNATWYDLKGRKLQGKPAQKGVYLRNGKTVVIK